MLDTFFFSRKDNGNNVETRFNIHIVLNDVGIGRLDDGFLFARRNGQIRLTEFIRSTGFHLDDDKHIAVFCHNVKFQMMEMPIAVKNFVALFDVMTGLPVFCSISFLAFPAILPP